MKKYELIKMLEPFDDEIDIVIRGPSFYVAYHVAYANYGQKLDGEAVLLLQAGTEQWLRKDEVALG